MNSNKNVINSNFTYSSRLLCVYKKAYQEAKTT